MFCFFQRYLPFESEGSAILTNPPASVTSMCIQDGCSIVGNFSLYLPNQESPGIRGGEGVELFCQFSGLYGLETTVLKS